MGIEHEIVDAVEIDKYAIKSFNAIHGTNFETQDITTWDKNIEVDLIMHGSPCFLRGEKINTDKGFKKIENIQVGDYVKSHDGSYNKVIQIMRNINNYIYDIKSSACHNINTTFNHPFYILRNNKKEWIQAKDLTTEDYMCIPINKKEEEIKWNGTYLNYNNHKEISNKLPLESPRFWYLIGRFIGDGWIVKRKDRNNNISGIKICCAKDELEDLENKLCHIFNYCVVEDKSTYKLQFSNKELGEFCKQFGVGAKNKHIPQHVLDSKKEYLEYLLMGIIDSDGCYSQGRYKITTISRDLAYNIGELILKLKKVPYHIYKTVRPKKYRIEERIINQNNTYQITWSNTYNKNINFVDENYLYSKIRKIENRIEINKVYNIEVENTHSYCVNNIATHNCQDFSVAGKQAGGDFGSGTRSSLMYETIRIVGKLRPKYVVWENVKNVLSKKHKHNFDRYIETMETLGYKNYYQVLDAKDYGIPQHRERVFTVSILGNNSFEFPKEHIEECKVINPLKDISGKSWQFEQNVYSENSILRSLKAGGGSGNIPKVIEHFEFPPKQELKLRLKDILEDEVDEKFYLNNVQIEKIKNSNFMQEKKRIQNGEISDTLLARDWKDPKCVQVGNLDIKGQDCIKRVYSDEGISPTLTSMEGGNRQPKIVVDK